MKLKRIPKYRGGTHVYWNLNFKQAKNIPVAFHNLKHYEVYHIKTNLSNYNDHKINVILFNSRTAYHFSIEETEK